MPPTNRHYIFHFFALAVIAIYLLPALIYGERSHVMIHDHLDDPFVRAKLLAESGMIFGPLNAKIDNIMNGAPISTMGSGLNVTLWLFYFLGPFGAYVANQLLIRIIAYTGMYFLLKRHILTEEQDRPARIGAALTFALLPYYAMFGLTIAGQPLALYAFLNIRKYGGGWKDWLIIAAIPFYSLFVLSYVFFITILALLWTYDLFRHHKHHLRFAAAIILMTCLFLLVDYRLVLAFLSPEYGFISHRTEFVFEHPDFNEALQRAIQNFAQGQGHAASLHGKIVLPAILLATGLVFWRRIREQRILALLALTALLSAWYGLWWNIWPELKALWPSLPYFNLSRFHYLHPLLWYIMFGIALSIFWKHLPKIGRPLCILFIALQLAFLFNRSDHITEKRLGKPSFGEFYSTALFKDIDHYIGKDKQSYRVCSLGIHPSIALYNGFYTLDGLLPNYPLSYKHQFRKLIEKELKKNGTYRQYFDEWGSRFYVFSSELQPLGTDAFELTKSAMSAYKPHVKSLDFNTGAFKAMGGQYLFSAIEIENAEQIGLHLEKIFDRSDSPWKIHLYSAR
jgi:hypothetical protein